DSEDLAVIQLKKVLSLNPKFIKAYALLALCMIKEHQIPKAQKILLKILTIDKNNYIARKYYDAISEEEPIAKVVQTEEESDSRQEASQPHRRAPILFGSSFHQVIFVLGGAIIGLAVALFLISPSQIKEKNLAISDLQDQVSIQTTELQAKSTALKEETIKREALDGEKVQLTSNLKKAQDIQGETAKVLLALQFRNAKDYVKAADELFFIDATKLEGTQMLEIFNTLKTEVYTIAAEDAFNSGSNSYFNEVYDKAIEQFDFSIKLAPNEKYSDKAFYYRGVAHYNLEQFEEARKDLEYVITNFPNSPRIENANWYLSKL
ncbi:MAG: tetratricopeptide repeat protein, partial [Vallitaleaceae bacterium]|nr:tetratricopeptide repeat protein [Vallitaleaceae bacterium]